MSEGRDDPELFWVDPKMRGVFPLERFHISRSLARRLRRNDFTVTFDRSFAEVLAACADRDETWINEIIASLYKQLHDLGHAHSVEVWRGRELIGGVYGVSIGGAFFGESMFSRATEGSKIALAYLTHHLRHQGYRLFDTQFLTDHLASLGAIEISRAEYSRQLAEAVELDVGFDAPPRAPSTQDVIQRNIQTS